MYAYKHIYIHGKLILYLTQEHMEKYIGITPLTVLKAYTPHVKELTCFFFRV